MNDSRPIPADTAAPLGGDDARVARALTEAAGALGAESGAVPEGFAALLFGRVAPEDLVGYDSRELAAMARDAWAFLAARKPGSPKIRFESPQARAGAHLKSVSAIEIVNDDMPFLVDSVMSELTERGLDIRLVVHPSYPAEDMNLKLQRTQTTVFSVAEYLRAIGTDLDVLRIMLRAKANEMNFVSKEDAIAIGVRIWDEKRKQMIDPELVLDRLDRSRAATAPAPLSPAPVAAATSRSPT